MHANQFRRLALAQGLLPARRDRATEHDDLPGAISADASARSGPHENALSSAEPAPEALH